MFPSTNYTSSSPYPCFPSSSSSSSLYPPFTFLNLENASANNTFHHIHDPVLSVPYIPTTTHHHAAIPETLTNWAVSDCSASMLKQDLSVSHYGISNFLTKKPAKKAVKKDRHSKIHTSQGLRDRRVRLSIDIARKFFDLQDMLGFDKASNTLDWLFTKSKKAIEELTRSKSTSNNDDDTLSSSEGEVVSLINNQQKVMDPNKDRKLKRAKMKEPKGKERARIVEEEEEQERYPENPQTFHHQLMRSSPFHSQLVGSELPRDNEDEDDDDFNVIEESIVIKRKKVKQSSISSSSHHHQNIVIPKETSFNNSDSNNSFPMSPNWDANGRSNFCAIATMNLSTGLQIFGKSWEECTSPHLY